MLLSLDIQSTVISATDTNEFPGNVISEEC